MKLKDILAISGKSGLYRFVSQARNGIIVESFDDKTRIAIPASTKVSALEDIAIFTASEEIPLAEVFRKIFRKEDGKQALSHKSSPEELKKYFETILPEYDRERVYISDIKKVVQWYNSLSALNLIDLEEEKEETEQKDQPADKKENEKITDKETKKVAPKKKTTAQPKNKAPKSVAIAKRTNQAQKKGA
jgi:hypothetical protein